MAHTVEAVITNKLQSDIRTTINNCQNIIQKEEKWKFINLKPTSPTIRGLVKLHKKGTRIRPIINWMNAPAYKLAKILAEKLQTNVPLSYVINVRNTAHLTLRRLMSYIYMEHPFLMFLDHTKRRGTVGRTPLDE